MYVITRLCQDCVDGACVEVCPADCILQHAPEEKESDLPNQLFIDPEACVGCHVCVNECPWEAIYRVEEVPVQFHSDIALNAITLERPHEFTHPGTHHTKFSASGKKPTQEEVLENFRKWDAESEYVA